MVAKEQQQDSHLVANALGSAAAGIVGRICTHPLDTAKARLQAVYSSTNSNSDPKKNGSSSSSKRRSSNPYRGPADVLVRTFRNEGIAGLYRGFGAVIVGGTPGTVIYLCTYEAAKDRLSRAVVPDDDDDGGSTSSDFMVHFSSGMIAETIACIVYVPVDVVKERLQVQRVEAGRGLRTGTADGGSAYYKNGWDAVKKISRSEGLSGIYRGYGATLASFGPFSALYFVVYERLKLHARRHLTGRTTESSRALDKVEIPFQWTVLCSASAGALASWLTSPLDLAKLRLQVSRGKLAATANLQQAGGGGVAYRGVLDCLQHAYRDGGVKGLFRGAGARVIHFAPATTITMTSYETCRSMVGNRLSS